MNKLRKSSNDRKNMNESKNSLYLRNINETAFVSSEEKVKTSKERQTSDCGNRESLTNASCNKYTLVNLWTGDLRWLSKNGQEVDQDKKPVDMCSNVATVSSRYSDLSNDTSINSMYGNRSEVTVDMPKNSKTESCRGCQEMRMRQIGVNHIPSLFSMPNIKPNTVGCKEDRLRQISLANPIADNQNKLYMNMSENSIGSGLKHVLCTSNIVNTGKEKSDSVERPMPYGNVHSRRCVLSKASQKSQVGQANSQNNDNNNSLNTMSKGMCDLQQTSTTIREKSDTNNICSSRPITGHVSQAKKSPDLRIPKRINYWDIDQPAVHSMSAKVSSHGKAMPSTVGQLYTNKVNRNFGVGKSTNINDPSLQKSSTPCESHPCVTFVESMSQTTMSLSRNRLAGHPCSLQSNDLSAKSQRIAKSDASTPSESLSIKLSSSRPSMPIRKRKRAIDTGTILVGSKLSAALNSMSSQLPKTLVPHTQRQLQQTPQSTKQQRDNIKESNVTPVPSKHTESNKKETNRHVQHMPNLEPSWSNTNTESKGINNNSDTHGTEGEVKQNRDTTSSRNSIVTQQILITVQSVPSTDLDYSKPPTSESVFKSNCNEEHKLNSTGIHVTTYPAVREQTPSFNNTRQVNYVPVTKQKNSSSNTDTGKVDIIPVKEQKTSTKNAGKGKVNIIPIKVQKSSYKNSIINIPVCLFPVTEKMPSYLYPVVREPTTSAINRMQREGHTKKLGLEEQVSSSSRVVHREEQAKCPILTESTNISICMPAVYRAVEDKNPEAQRQIPTLASTSRKAQANCPIQSEPLPSFINSIHGVVVEEEASDLTHNSNNIIHRSTEEDYPAISEHNSSHISRIQREGQCIRESIQSFCRTCGEAHDNCAEDIKPMHCVTRKVQDNYIEVEEEKRTPLRSIHKGQENYTAVREQCPRSIRRDEQVDNPAVREEKQNWKQTVPLLITKEESDKYSYRSNNLDYWESKKFSPPQDLSNQQLYHHCNSSSVRDECKSEYSNLCKDNQRVELCGKVQTKNVCKKTDESNDMQQGVRKASIIKSLGCEHLVNSTMHHIVPQSTDKQKKTQAAWERMEILSKQNITNTPYYNTQSYHEYTAEIQPICVEEKQRVFQSQMHELPKPKWINCEKLSDHSNKDEKYLTLKSLPGTNEISLKEKATKEAQSELLKQPEEERKSKESCEQGSKNAKCISQKSMADKNHRHVKLKSSRVMQLQVDDQSETEQKTPKQWGKLVSIEEKYIMPLECQQTHAEEQCFPQNQNEMVIQKSKTYLNSGSRRFREQHSQTNLTPKNCETLNENIIGNVNAEEQCFPQNQNEMVIQKSKTYLNSGSRRFREEHSQTNLTPDNCETLNENIIGNVNGLENRPPKQMQPMDLSNWLDAAARQENSKNTTTKLQGTEATRPKSVQHYHIKWMTRKENKLNEQAMTNKLDEVNLAMPVKVNRRQRKTNRKISRASTNITRCSMDTAMQTNKSTKPMQPKISNSESSLQENNYKFNENCQESSQSLNHVETPPERGKNTSTSIAETPAAHADGDSSVAWKWATNPNQGRIHPTMKDVATYCNFKHSQNIVQQLKAEYGNFEALTTRMKNITKKVLSRVDREPMQPKCLDRKIKDLYDYCQTRKLSPLQNVEYSGKRKKRSRFSTSLIAEQDDSQECYNKSEELDNEKLLGEETEVEALLEIGILGRGCCGLPPLLTHMHGVISSVTTQEDVKILKLQYGDIQYVIEDNTISKTKISPEEETSQTECLATVTIPSGNLWERIQELYEYSTTLYTTVSSSKMSVRSDAVPMTQSTLSTNMGTSDHSLAQLKITCNGTTERYGKADLGQQYNSTSNWDDNQGCNIDCNKNVHSSSENTPQESSGNSEKSEHISIVPNNVSAQSEKVLLECNDISTKNDNMTLESNNILSWKETIPLEYNDNRVYNISLEKSNDVTNLNEPVLSECSSISANSESKALEPDDVCTLNEIIYLDCNTDVLYTNNKVGKQKCINKRTMGENMVQACNYNYNTNDSIILFDECNNARNENVNDLSECNNSNENKNTFPECNEFQIENESFTLESSHGTGNKSMPGRDESQKFDYLQVEDGVIYIKEAEEISKTSENSLDANNTLLGTHKSQTAYQTNNLRTFDNIAHHHHCQPPHSNSLPAVTNTYQFKHNEDQNIPSNESKNLSVNAELVNNSTLNLVLKFPSTEGFKTDNEVNLDEELGTEGHEELVHSSIQMLPIAVTLEHADLSKENVPMVSTIISVKNSSLINKKLCAESETIKLDSESVKLSLGVEYKSHSEQDVDPAISKHFLFLKQSQLQGVDSAPNSCYTRDQDVPRSCHNFRSYNPKVIDNKPQAEEDDIPNGAYTLNVYVIREPGVDLHVKTSESSLK